MSFEENLVAAAIEATGDESIQDVADFEPKGTAGASMAGAVVGGAIGGASVGGDGWGDAIARGVGAGGGLAAGRVAAGVSRDLPRHIAVAVSPSEVYVLGYKGSGWHPRLEPLGKIDRDKLGIEVHQRVSVRTLVLEDLESGAKFKLEVGRLNFYHGKAFLELLMMSDQHHDEEPTEGDFAPAV